MPVRKVHLPFHVQEQIEDTLAYTLLRFGTHKHEEYDRLLERALTALERNAELGDRRPDIGDDVWLYPISRGGGRARHVFLYSITENAVQIEAFRYDAMDLPSHWPHDK